MSHKTYGETFYQLELSIDRRSGYRDAINIMISDRLLFDKTLNKGDMLHINGQVRTYNTAVNGKNRLNVVVFARELEVLEDIEYYQNEIYLEGYICKPPIREPRRWAGKYATLCWLSTECTTNPITYPASHGAETLPMRLPWRSEKKSA